MACGGGGVTTVETFQTQWELDRLLDVVRQWAPANILEIGVWEGGTLWHWLQVAPSVVAIDDRMMRRATFSDWADEAGTQLVLLHGRSQDESVIHAAETLAPYDFVFIDGDHSYDSVKADWENYAPMVKEDGIVAFHDIVERPGYGVSRLWSELKAADGARWMELGETVAPDNETKHGIGLLWM